MSETDQLQPLYSRLVVRGTLQMLSAFHLGSGSASRLSDMAIRRDAKGMPYIPGSSLAGLLRSAAEELAPYVIGQQPCHERDKACFTCNLFGWSPSGPGGGVGQASRIAVDDALTAQDLQPVVEIRDHVGIDRRTGATRKQLQYDREVSPGNMAFRFEIAIEEPSVDDIRLLLAVFDLWASDEVGLRLGGRTTAGLGRAVLRDLTFFGLDFSNDGLLLDYLCPAGESVEIEPLPEKAKVSPSDLRKELGNPPAALPVQGKERHLPQRVVIDLSLEALEPLLIAGNTPKLGTDTQQPSDTEFVFALQQTPDGKIVETPYLPGSSLKGVLRSRAEKIVRTLNYAAGPDQYEQNISACAITHSKLEENERDWLQACFGGEERMDTAENQGEEKLYQRSCVTCRLFGNTTLRGRLLLADSFPDSETAAKLFDHVAIDRFSGGAADAKKFDTRPLLPGARFTIHLELERFEPWMLGFVTLMLKDWHASDIWLGHATRRGYGRVRAWVTGSQALILTGSELDQKIKKAALPTGDDFGPYRRVSLGLERFFGRETAEAPIKDDPAAVLLEECFAEFKDIVSRLQPQLLGLIPEES